MDGNSNSSQKKNFNWTVIVLTAAAFFASIIAVSFNHLMPGNIDDLQPGIPSPVRFQAQRQILNYYAMEEAEETAAAAVETHMMHDAAISQAVLYELEGFFIEIGDLRAAYVPLFSPFAPTPIDDEEPFSFPVADELDLSVPLDDAQVQHIITGDSATFARFMRVITALFEESLEENLTTITHAVPGIANSLREQEFDEIYVAIGHAVTAEILRPNMVENEEATEAARQEARENVAPIYFYANQNIVLEGDIITPEAYRALIELGLIGGDGGAILVGVIGATLIVTVVFGIAIAYILMQLKELMSNRRRIFMLFTLYMVTLALARVMVPLQYFFTPVMLFAMLVAILLGMRLAIVLTVGLSIIIVAMEPTQAMYLNFAIINGIFAAMIAKNIVSRGKIFMAMVLLGSVNVLTVLANYFLFSVTFSMDVLNSVIFALVGGFITIWLTIGTLPLWESLFEVVTQNNLLELTNPNNALLRRMAIETPGTYHHSIVVANLSETACYDIGANHVLARVGAYYHDIGKMKYPQYFAENQNGVNPHDAMPPRTSVEVITDHITRGMELAKQHKLPLPIRAFIAEHHGTSMMKVFYHKEKTRTGDDINEQEFRYKNSIPQSRESAVVMLADTSEAAVRSVVSKSGKDLEKMENMVRMLIKDKLEDGQLNDSGLSIKDLDTIAKAFMRVFKGMYHERVPYPSASSKELLSAPAAPVAEEVEVSDDEKLGDFDGK